MNWFRFTIATSWLLVIQVASAQSTTSLRHLADLREGVTRRRVSSNDPTGGNNDRLENIAPGKRQTLIYAPGPGTITHVWVTIASSERYHLRRIVLRAFWDGEDNPSIECPIGDFFGLGFGEANYWSSAPLAVADRGMNCFFPMPFAKSARIEIENQGEQPIRAFYYHVDYETYEPESDAARAIEHQGRFHAWFNRRITQKDDHENYLVLDAEGKGQFVGVVMHIQALSTGWWGEGDDQFIIDDGFVPNLKGTGLEDYFCGAWNFNLLNREFNFPYFGYSRKGNPHPDYTGRHSMYRFHIEDPIPFEKSLRFSIEHGHANDRGDDYSSVAYWYQTEPHAAFPPLPAVDLRVPRLHPVGGPGSDTK